MNRCADFLCVRFEREMAGIEETDIRGWYVTAESFRPCGKEKRIILAPDGEKWRLMGAEIRLELRIAGHIVRIVEEKIELNSSLPGRLK